MQKENLVFLSLNTTGCRPTLDRIFEIGLYYWNREGHRVFPHVSRAIEGIPINTVEEAQQRIRHTKTKTGLTVTTDIIKKTYQKGKAVTQDFMENMKIKFDKSLGKFNYTISPVVT